MDMMNERREPCQRLCHCGQPLTPDDLDGQCVGCRGNMLTLYPKTPAVRAKDTHYIEYRRKKDRKYEPGTDERSDYFWCCQQCHMRLGPAYLGDPDERGYCSKCVELERIGAKREADAIEAAGGLKAWQRKRLIKQRKRLINKILFPIDCIAIFICVIALSAAAFATILFVIVGVLKELRHIWSTDDRVLLFILAISVAWCALRWKTLNARPSEY